MIEVIAPVIDEQPTIAEQVIVSELDAARMPADVVVAESIPVLVVPKPSYSAEEQAITNNIVAGFGILSFEQRQVRQRMHAARRAGRLAIPR